MIATVVLAAGKGTRMKAGEGRNKVTLDLNGKPLVRYAVELAQTVSDKVFVVVGSYPESVKLALQGLDVVYVTQQEQLGTAHAVQVAIPDLLKARATDVIVGCADHMMFYKADSVKSLLKLHQDEQADLSMFTSRCDNPSDYGYGRIVRKNGHIVEIVEDKEANPQQKLIQEFNPGFYCFRMSFLQAALPQIKPSAKSGEYYLTDLVGIAVKNNLKVTSVEVLFSQVGIGANKPEDLEAARKLFMQS